MLASRFTVNNLEFSFTLFVTFSKVLKSLKSLKKVKIQKHQKHQKGQKNKVTKSINENSRSSSVNYEANLNTTFKKT